MPGNGLLLLMANQDIAALAGKSIPFVLGFCASCLATSKLRDWSFYVIIALCFISILMSLVFLFLLRDPALAHEMYDNSNIAAISSSAPYEAGLNNVFLPLTAWLIGTLAVQLGIKLTTASVPTPPPAPTPAPGPKP
jgi:hypothetical protein